MKIFYILVLLCFIVGCEKSTPQSNTITVTENNVNYNGSAQTDVEIRYDTSGGAMTVRLDTLEEISDYKKKVDFLCNRLDEIELKMSLQEPDPTGEEVSINL